MQSIRQSCGDLMLHLGVQYPRVVLHLSFQSSSFSLSCYFHSAPFSYTSRPSQQCRLPSSLLPPHARSLREAIYLNYTPHCAPTCSKVCPSFFSSLWLLNHSFICSPHSDWGVKEKGVRKGNEERRGENYFFLPFRNDDMIAFAWSCIITPLLFPR